MDLRQTAVLMLTAGTLLVCVHTQAVCRPTWFGSLCQYKCRCLDHYCTTEGICEHGVPCEGGWFGPACQYEDLAFHRSPARDATDGDDQTCLKTTANSPVTVTLDHLYHVTWLRVRLSNPDLLYNLTVRFGWDASLSCTNTRTARVDNMTLDIHCDLNENVEYVMLSGEGVRHLCSVYISGGRNVALRQNSSQSSTYSENSRRIYPSQLAVDGNSSPLFYRGNSCSHTLSGDPHPNLNISFSKPQRVTRYVLYNRGDPLVGSYRAPTTRALGEWLLQCVVPLDRRAPHASSDTSQRIDGFEVRSFGLGMTPVFNYTDSSYTKMVYTVVPDQVTPPILIVNVAVSNTERMLTLCELEVYGDSACQPGKYGRECEHTCHCAGDQSCFVSTGGCPSGCAAGFLGQDCATGCDVGNYGPGCQLVCSQFCVRDGDPGAHFCDNTNGTCLHGCQSGYQGPNCSERCDVGSHGPGCQFACSQFCVRDGDPGEHFCDNTNGTCLHGCQSGYQGPNCNERCDVGSYGPSCQLACSQFCVRGRNPGAHFCDNTNGTCLHGCQSGYQGPNCTERCDVGSHGPDCQLACSQFCVRGSDPGAHFCDNTNGTCLHGCQSGYQGPNCAERCDLGSYGPGCQLACSQFCVRGSDPGPHFCDNINGTCLYGCQSGYQVPNCTERCDVGSHGPGCQLGCSQFCVRGSDPGAHFCDNTNGTCLHGCQSGYQGPNCTERCDLGSYGPGCQLACSQFCVRGSDSGAHFCDNTNGTCLHGCQSGYQGPKCTERCDLGSYGPGCQFGCSQFCVRGRDPGAHFCDNTNGTCLHGCQSGYQGPNCTERCDLGSYGPGCQLACSQFCVRGSDPGAHFCDNTNGTCLYGCQSGYQGPNCTERCDVGSHGPGCQLGCSQFCVRGRDPGAHFCDNTNGTCLHGCQIGYQGPKCTKRCDLGSYGPGCQLACSQFCVRGSDSGAHFCDNTNGTCLHGCQSGYQGPKCTERCDVGSHGPGCQLGCSQFCVRGRDPGAHFCDNTNGTCLHGCQIGYQGPKCTKRCDLGSYGPGCQLACSQFCVRGSDSGAHFCDNTNGTCLHGCQSGYQGPKCTERCDVGSHGPGCQLGCSQFCVRGRDPGAHFCDNTNGTCLHGCQIGYQGPKCTKRCDLGSYGPGCQLACSQFCVRGSDSGAHFCDNTNGTCLHGCQSGYQGPKCTERCDLGSYGPGCQLACSQFCVRGSDSGAHFCDNTNGTCLHGCQSGYQGPKCTERCDVGSHGPGCQLGCSQFCVRGRDPGAHFCDTNGTCLHGCQSGYQGPNCTERCDVGSHGRGCQLACSQFCVRDLNPGEHFCDNTNGTCLHGCQSGYQGPNCTERCDVGSHGPGCQLGCSQFCVRGSDPGAHFCDNTNGTCLHGCQSGFQGPNCTEKCDLGSHGPGCQLACSQFCVRGRDPGAHFCDNTNGTCLHGCQSGYQGSNCTERCEVGSHGPACQLACSQFCERDGDPRAHFCDNTNGTCLHGCQIGYQGSNCTEKLSNNDNVNVSAVVSGPVVGGVGVLVLVVVAVVFWRRRQKIKSKAPAESNEYISLSRNDLCKVHQTLTDGGHDTPEASTAVTKPAGLKRSQGKIESEDMFGYDCAFQSYDDRVALLDEETSDYLTSS